MGTLYTLGLLTLKTTQERGAVPSRAWQNTLELREAANKLAALDSSRGPVRLARGASPGTEAHQAAGTLGAGQGSALPCVSTV